jgi:acetyltransferase-like isoleucine patch superfamily enzyme/carbamoylphosphate synthase large subunit
MISPLADIRSKLIGEGTDIWQFVIVLEQAQIGKNCNINAHCFIENDVILGDNVTVKCGVYLWDGFRAGNNVFIGPNVTFINDNYPRSKSYPDKFLQTKIEDGASLGAGCVILGGITIGKNSMIGAGSTVTKNVPENELWVGSPARFVKKIDKQITRTVLIGSAGTGIAYASILALRRNWGNKIKIIAIDSNPDYLVTSSLFADKFIQVPLGADFEFENKLETVLVNEDVDTYVPFIDHEIYVGASLFEKKLRNKVFNLQIKNSEIAEICDDKYKTFLFLTENNILTPKCFLTHELISNAENLIIKPRKGFGSKTFQFLENRENISKFNSEDYIIQQECEKPEITVDVSYEKVSGFFTYVCRERIEVKSGVCSKARLFYDKKIEIIALSIAQKLDLSSFCFQLMKLNGEWAVTDINARLGAGTAISVAAGLDFFSGMFAILWGEDPSPYFRPLQKETFVTRQYSEFVMNR